MLWYIDTAHRTSAELRNPEIHHFFENLPRLIFVCPVRNSRLIFLQAPPDVQLDGAEAISFQTQVSSAVMLQFIGAARKVSGEQRDPEIYH